MAKQRVGQLRAELELDGQKYRLELKEAGRATKKFGDGATRSFRSVVKGAAIVGTTGLASVTAFSIVIRQAAKRLDELGKVSDRLGILPERLQALRIGASETGVGVRTLDMSLQRMVRRISEAARGTGEAKDAIEELGLSAVDLAQLSPDEQMAKISEAMKDVASEGDRVRLAVKLFDSEGVKLVNTLKAMDGSMEGFNKEAERLGQNFSREQIRQVEAANDALSKLGTVTSSIAESAAIAIAPSLQAAAEAAVELAEGLIPTTDEMGSLGEISQVVFGTILDGLQTALLAINLLETGLSGTKLLVNDIGTSLGLWEIDVDEMRAQLKAFEEDAERIDELRREWSSETLERRLADIKREREARQANNEDAKQEERELTTVVIESMRKRMAAAQARFDLRKEQDLAEQERLKELLISFDTEEQAAKRAAEKRIEEAWELAFESVRSADWAADQEERIRKDLQERLAAIRKGDDTGSDDPTEVERMRQRLEALQQFGIEEAEQQRLINELKLEELRRFRNQELITEQEFIDAQKAMVERAEAEKVALARRSSQMRLNAVIGDANNIIRGLDALGSVLMKDTKAWNHGMAVANTALGVTKALASQNWPLAFATAAAGAAQVSAISSSGKGRGSVAGVSGGSQASAPPPSPAPAATQQQNITIEVRRASGSVTREEASQLFDELLDISRDRNDGVRVI